MAENAWGRVELPWVWGRLSPRMGKRSANVSFILLIFYFASREGALDWRIVPLFT